MLAQTLSTGFASFSQEIAWQRGSASAPREYAARAKFHRLSIESNVTRTLRATIRSSAVWRFRNWCRLETPQKNPNSMIKT